MINSFSGKEKGFALAQSVLRLDGINSELQTLNFYQQLKEKPQQVRQVRQLQVCVTQLTPDEVQNLLKQRMPPEGQFHSC